jgi:hypothetical protein
VSYLREGINDYGTPVSWFKCDACDGEFSVCPAVTEDRYDEWTGCMADTCDSYDIVRDISIFFDAMVESGMLGRAPTSNQEADHG